MVKRLTHQPVYYQRERVVKPMGFTVLAVSILLVVLVCKIFIKVQIVDAGYDLSQERKLSHYLKQRKQELELQKSVLMRPDYIQKAAYRQGLKPVSPEQIVNFNE